MAVFSAMAVDSSWGNVCVSQVQCNPLKAFVLASYGKQAVALRLWGAIQNCPVRIPAREKVSATDYWLLLV
jgi:hypothetical protein